MTVEVSRAARRWIVAALAALLAAWIAAPAVVPIYDGPGNPDEPYRYVRPPAGATATKPPTDATAQVKVGGNGLNISAYVNSQENGPQISIYLPASAVKAPAGASSVTLTATPLAPSSPLPTDGAIVGNIYDISAMSAQGPVTIVGRGDNLTPTLQMRAPSDRQPGPVFEHLADGKWVRSQTLRVGTDIYQSFAPTFGQWALVQLANQPGASKGGGINTGLLAAGIAILALAAILLAIRMTRSRRASTA